jgi:hypothetical protein
MQCPGVVHCLLNPPKKLWAPGRLDALEQARVNAGLPASGWDPPGASCRRISIRPVAAGTKLHLIKRPLWSAPTVCPTH